MASKVSSSSAPSTTVARARASSRGSAADRSLLLFEALLPELSGASRARLQAQLTQALGSFERSTACGIPVNGTQLCQFQWQRANVVGQDYIDIKGAVLPEYRLSADDIDTQLRVQCTPLSGDGRAGETVTAGVNNGNLVALDARRDGPRAREGLRDGPRGRSHQLQRRAPELSARLASPAPQAAPPCCGALVSRVLVCGVVSAPQVFRHAVHEPHRPTSQSTGHDCWLQSSCSVSGGHALPPNFGLTSAIRF